MRGTRQITVMGQVVQRGVRVPAAFLFSFKPFGMEEVH